MMKWAAYSRVVGWLMDTCAGGVWSWRVAECAEFDSESDAKLACEAAGIETEDLLFLRVR